MHKNYFGAYHERNKQINLSFLLLGNNFATSEKYEVQSMLEKFIFPVSVFCFPGYKFSRNLFQFPLFVFTSTTLTFEAEINKQMLYFYNESVLRFTKILGCGESLFNFDTSYFQFS